MKTYLMNGDDLVQTCLDEKQGGIKQLRLRNEETV